MHVIQLNYGSLKFFALCCRFAANGWPITTTTHEGLGVQVKNLILASAVSMGTATSAKIAGGLLDAYAALQLVPVDPSSTSSTSASSSSFGDTSTPASPEEENPFASDTATQSGDFVTAVAFAPVPALSAQQQAVSSAVQAAAVAAVNTTVNSTQSFHGATQAVLFGPSDSALGPQSAAMLIDSLRIQAPAVAPAAVGQPEAAFVPEQAPAVPPSSQQVIKSRKISV